MEEKKLNVFIEKARKVHGGKYDYSKVNYANSLTKVCIICPIHGEFWQTPQAHVRGNNCPKCANKKRGDAFRMSEERFIERANITHKLKYTYEPNTYVNMLTKIPITCPEHGVFYMTPMNHLAGQGCPKCASRGCTTSEFVEKARKVHGDKYDYSKVEIGKMHSKVCIICPQHGEFWQTPSKHLLGQGCPRCNIEKRSNEKKMTSDEFIEKARKVHGDKYDYSKVEYVGTYDPITIICKEHGEFKQRANDHLSGHGCPICGNNMSIGETEICEYIKELGCKVVEKDKSVLCGKEIDLLIPEAKIGVEFDGLYWHSDEYKDRSYHLNKTDDCAKSGIRLIHVFEDEWVNKSSIVKSMLCNILNKTPIRIYARNCVVREVEQKEKREFLKENHIQGDVSSKINLGLYFNDILVSMMCFGGTRISLGSKIHEEGEFELLRFCNKLFTSVVGGASKLFKHFIENYNPSSIISYCDRRWSVGEMYEKLGFEFIHKSQPNYYYIVGNNRENRFKYRKSMLVKEGYDETKSETEIMRERGIRRIYDCGTFKFVWKKNN